jgi:hypothetical protein
MVWRRVTPEIVDERVAIVAVDGDEAEAGELCKRALLEVGAPRPGRIRRHCLRAADEMRFEFAPDGEGGTQIRMVARASRALDRVARWLAQHGDGRVIDVDRGRLNL